ncbi:hypothetical protein GCM10007320_29720 [Pseudorhodoferax aquiterrae]|uniref:Uncharacterized protein n=1 Tax=Pseudorhodoferax aquiterrae TaxID=747304 RepID=A0ABQ3G2Y5_9BURK|nr:hypothetical protein GCM10007320_29720 [Pseudorhodoferax aquiterrae]
MQAEHQVRALLDRYTSMFRQPDLLDVYAGWVSPLVALCAEVEVLLVGGPFVFHFTRIKEKFGQCRISFVLEHGPDARRTAETEDELERCTKEIEQRVKAAQCACASRCLVCGRTAAAPAACMPTPLCKLHAWSEDQRDPWSIGKIHLTVRLDR